MLFNYSNALERAKEKGRGFIILQCVEHEKHLLKAEIEKVFKHPDYEMISDDEGHTFVINVIGLELS